MYKIPTGPDKVMEVRNYRNEWVYPSLLPSSYHNYLLKGGKHIVY